MDTSDLAEQILPIITPLSRNLRAPVELISVIQRAPEELELLGAVEDNPLIAAWRSKTQDYLEGIAARLRLEELETSTSISQGDSASCIINEAARDPGTLIAISTHGWAGATQWNLGSVTLKVLQNTDNPVLVVRARVQTGLDTPTELDSIIVPLDGSAVSAQVIPHVTTLAQAQNLKVILVRATPSVWEYYTHMDHTVVHSGDPSEMAKERAQGYLHTISKRLADRNVSVVEQRVERGDPASVIMGVVEKSPGSLVAMVSRGVGSAGLRRRSMGSVAQRVAGTSQSPVLIVQESEPETA